MANLAITSVKWVAQFTPISVKLKESVSQFDLLYVASDNQYGLAVCTDATKILPTAIALMAGVAGEWVPAVKLNVNDQITITATPAVAQGVQYYLSATGGKIAPYADLVTGNYVSQTILGKSAGVAVFNPQSVSVQIP